MEACSLLVNLREGIQSSSEQPLVGEERYVTTLIAAAKETIRQCKYRILFYQIRTFESRVRFLWRAVSDKNTCCGISNTSSKYIQLILGNIQLMEKNISLIVKNTLLTTKIYNLLGK